MKKKSIIILVAALGFLVAYGFNNFGNDKQSLIKAYSIAASDDFPEVFKMMDTVPSLSNPIINYIYQKWKTKMESRFITRDEVFENTSGNKVVNDVTAFYRNYWTTELLKEDAEKRTDSVLYDNIINYIWENKLTSIVKDSLVKNIKDDTELTKILDKEGFSSKFMLRNGFQDIFIWDKETVGNYTVSLPKETIETKVIFMSNYHIMGYDAFATFGDAQVGGWAIKEAATLYCNKGDYDLDSEKFKVSYLKHESIHFTDLNEYPNLSSADLEYRAKLIELMYCTKKTIYDRVLQFLNGANKNNRKNAHPYANYCLIQNLSEIIFKTPYENDISKWEDVTVEELNKAATDLYNKSEKELAKNKKVAEII